MLEFGTYVQLPAKVQCADCGDETTRVLISHSESGGPELICQRCAEGTVRGCADCGRCTAAASVMTTRFCEHNAQLEWVCPQCRLARQYVFQGRNLLDEYLLSRSVRWEHVGPELTCDCGRL